MMDSTPSVTAQRASRLTQLEKDVARLEKIYDTLKNDHETLKSRVNDHTLRLADVVHALRGTRRFKNKV